ncbi:MAG: exodeoxyribonuclease VII small subunit [Acidobacteriota bacterium]|nr:exodeoxyribonuclease VII small subunit [Acidobacteriota bacterium]
MPDKPSNEFEQSLERLEAIVKELEREDVDLDRAVTLFKEGKDRARQCEELLKSSQAAIEKAMKGDPDPQPSPQPRNPAGESLFDDEIPF